MTLVLQARDSFQTRLVASGPHVTLCAPPAIYLWWPVTLERSAGWAKRHDLWVWMRRAPRSFYEKTRPMSLRRMARREKDKLAIETRFARLRRERFRSLPRSLGDEFSFVLLAPLALGVPFLPLH